jgi:hypothetical protein
MGWTMAILLLVLGALGLVSALAMGGFVHVLLIAAAVVLLVRVVQTHRAPLPG